MSSIPPGGPGTAPGPGGKKFKEEHGTSVDPAHITAGGKGRIDLYLLH